MTVKVTFVFKIFWPLVDPKSVYLFFSGPVAHLLSTLSLQLKWFTFFFLFLKQKLS